LATPLALRSVVIRDFYFVRPVRLPNETDPVLLIDSDAVLSGAVAVQGLKPVPGGDAQIDQAHGCLDLVQLALGDGRNGCPAPAVTRLKELLRCRVFEALDHLESGYNARRYM
jgi:hypothetical protein